MADDDIELVLAEIREAIAEIQGETAEVREKAAARRDAERDADDDLAAGRRRGDEGRDWQVVQQRIDLGRTTLSDVISGIDLSPEARAVRAQLQKLLPGARAQFAAIVEKGEAEGEFAGLAEAQAKLAVAVDALRATDLDL